MIFQYTYDIYNRKRVLFQRVPLVCAINGGLKELRIRSTYPQCLITLSGVVRHLCLCMDTQCPICN
jgi:hypothetical protein